MKKQELDSGLIVTAIYTVVLLLLLLIYQIEIGLTIVFTIVPLGFYLIRSSIVGWIKFIGIIIGFLPVFLLMIGFIQGMSFTTTIGTDVSRILNPSTTGQGGMLGSLTDILSGRWSLTSQVLGATATQKEVKEVTGPPTVAFTVSGETFPTSGCYDTTNYQLIAKVKNTGGDYISDISITTENDNIFQLGNTCDDITLTECQWGSGTTIPSTVTVEKSCLINPIIKPAVIYGRPAKAQSCYIVITAETGYQSVSRLGLEFIEPEYARSKFELKQLTQTRVPAISSVAPVEFGIGGLQQPILYYENSALTLMTTITNKGTGIVSSYESAYMFIPNVLLEDGQCSSVTDNWECITELNCNQVGNTIARGYCNKYLTFKNNKKIGNYAQFDYDNSHDLLNQDYSICFYKKELEPEALTNTGTCTLKTSNTILSNEAIRNTLLIRGDVLYKYQMKGEVNIKVTDCDIS